jgi:murein DD-endopeptidase MepM/ murein hydrolase activator NlpD
VAEKAIQKVLQDSPSTPRNILKDRTLAQELTRTQGERQNLSIPADLSLPKDAMRPISPSEVSTRAIDLYPDNKELLNPFGRGVEVVSQGLMQWLAPRSGGRWHSGLDLVPHKGRANGAKLYAPGNGIVLRRRDWHPAWGSYLIAVFRQGEKLYLTGFFHLKRRSHHMVKERNIEKGVTGLITRGQFIGRVGHTGAARGAHLHVDVVELKDIRPPDLLSRLLWSGRTWSEFVNPAKVFQGLPVAVYHGRQRPNSGLIVRAHRPDHNNQS